MIIKKALFGGYKRNVVDQMITQWSEEKSVTQSKVEMMEIELGLSKDTSKRLGEQLNADIKIKDKSIELLRAELDKKKTLSEQLAGVVETKNAQIADLWAQVEQRDRIINSQGQKTDDTYDEGLRRIGQLYVDAKNYTDMIKSDAQIKTNEAVDLFFEAISKSREDYLTITNQISQKKRAISELTHEMNGTLKLLRNNIENFDIKPSDDPYAKLEEIKRQIKDRINEGFNPFGLQNDEYTSTSAPEVIETKENLTYSNELESKIATFASQIEELKNTLQLQQEMLDNKVGIQEKSQITEHNPLPSDDNIIILEPSMADSLYKDPENSKDILPAPKTVSDSQTYDYELRSEQERLEREKYSLYFSEIERKYKRDSAAGRRYAFSNSPATGDVRGTPTDSTNDDFVNTSTKTDSEENKKSESPASDESASTHGKKPSIKEILDKYANLK